MHTGGMRHALGRVPGAEHQEVGPDDGVDPGMCGPRGPETARGKQHRAEGEAFVLVDLRNLS